MLFRLLFAFDALVLTIILFSIIARAPFVPLGTGFWTRAAYLLVPFAVIATALTLRMSGWVLGANLLLVTLAALPLALLAFTGLFAFLALASPDR